VARLNQLYEAFGEPAVNRTEQRKSLPLGPLPSTKRTPEERHHWSLITGRMGQQLKEYYRACTAEELSPLLTLLKKLDQELPEERDQ
jgi:hypothetical protein